MAQDTLTAAWKLMNRRRFSTAARILEERSEIYQDNFEYYLTTGIAYLYIGDIGVASSYFQLARKLKLTDTRLMLAQAVIFLRRGETDRALQYYLEIKENDPQNKIADDAIEFIRTQGDYDTICKWKDTGKIEVFYPPLGNNPERILGFVIPVAACLLGCLLFLVFFAPGKKYGSVRMELSALELSDEEKRSAKEKDLSTQTFMFVFTDKEITRIFDNAINFFQEHRDNASQVEVNRLLNANASSAIKQKAHVLTTYYEIPDFDTIRDVPSYSEVKEVPALYSDCWIAWGGKISNVTSYEDGSYSCDLLVGDEDFKHYEGSVRVLFEAAPVMDGEHYVRILGRIGLENGGFFVRGRAVYQSIHK